MTAFLISLVAVALAEMGDKTQLLAMAFAARYRSSSVLLGVFLATVLNHALAVAAGYWLASLVTVREWVEGLAAVSFVLFGLWTIRGDSLSGQEGGVGRYGPVLTVAVAFFLAEMGDKTQLATVSLATRFPEWPLAVLIGTTAGMLVADAFGIVVGVMLCRRIPERLVKLVSAAAFIGFGWWGIFGVLDKNTAAGSMAPAAVTAAVVVVTAVVAVLCWRLGGKRGGFGELAARYCRLRRELP